MSDAESRRVTCCELCGEGGLVEVDLLGGLTAKIRGRTGRVIAEKEKEVLVICPCSAGDRFRSSKNTVFRNFDQRYMCFSTDRIRAEKGFAARPKRELF